MIDSLALRSFRNHYKIDIDASNEKFIVITGPNGAGKTSILEAISLLLPGKGIKDAELSSFLHTPAGCTSLAYTKNVIDSWSIQANYMGLTHMTGARYLNGRFTPRIVKINDKLVTKYDEIPNTLKIIWFLPRMEGLFTAEPAVRRAFIDRIAYNMNYEHLKYVKNASYIAKSRLNLLKRGVEDDALLTILESSLVEAVCDVMDGRIDAINSIKSYFSHINGFVTPNIEAFGKIYDINTSPNRKQLLTTALRDNRKLDAVLGRTSMGLSKMDIATRHTIKNIDAINCSTGEQKSMLISIILAQIIAIGEKYNTTPILLLDDIVESLDQQNRSALASALFYIRSQVWISAIDGRDIGMQCYKAVSLQ